MTREEKIKNFNPGDVGQHNGRLFGLPFDEQECPLVILPVPWDVTVSYGDGTHRGPEAILKASPQLDFYDKENPDAWKTGFFMHSINHVIESMNDSLRARSNEYIRSIETGADPAQFAEVLKEINDGCEWMRQHVHEMAGKYLDEGKTVCLLGGDHSTPLGLYQAMSERLENFGILQIDAHADLRQAYEGFTFSHASIFYNAVQIPQLEKLVQVGIRDQSHEEATLAEKNTKITQFTNDDLQRLHFKGENWDAVCRKIVDQLPQRVHISFDIDGLDPKYCPNTGTPVPGGLAFDQAVHLFRTVIQSGRKIISFDLCEVNPGDNEWDANVGARMLWKLCSLTALSNNNYH